MRMLGMQSNWRLPAWRVRIVLCLIAIGWLGAGIVATVGRWT